MEERIKELEAELEKLRQENELLRQKIDLLIKRIFGSSSEKVDLDQLLLFDDQAVKKCDGDGPAEPEDKKPSPPRNSSKKRKRTSREATLPDNLPTEETTILPEEVEQSPQHYR